MEPKAEYQQQVQEQEQTKLDAWAIIDLFGHSHIAGRVSEFTIGGSSMIRVDVPAVGDRPGFTKLYGTGAIYSISFVDEATARSAVAAIEHRPITVYIPSQRALPRPDGDDGYD